MVRRLPISPVKLELVFCASRAGTLISSCYPEHYAKESREIKELRDGISIVTQYCYCQLCEIVQMLFVVSSVTNKKWHLQMPFTKPYQDYRFVHKINIAALKFIGPCIILTVE